MTVGGLESSSSPTGGGARSPIFCPPDRPLGWSRRKSRSPWRPSHIGELSRITSRRNSRREGSLLRSIFNEIACVSCAAWKGCTACGGLLPHRYEPVPVWEDRSLVGTRSDPYPHRVPMSAVAFSPSARRTVASDRIHPSRMMSRSSAASAAVPTLSVRPCPTAESPATPRVAQLRGNSLRNPERWPRDTGTQVGGWSSGQFELFVRTVPRLC